MVLDASIWVQLELSQGSRLLQDDQNVETLWVTVKDRQSLVERRKAPKLIAVSTVGINLYLKRSRVGSEVSRMYRSRR